MEIKNRLTGLETDRFRFVAFNDLHIPYLLSFYGEKSNLRYINPDPPEAKSYVPEMLKRQEDLARRTGFGFCALIHRDTGDYLGQGGYLVQKVDGTRELEVAYQLMPEHRGMGYATEMARFCLDLAFEEKLTDSLISIIHPENIASQKVALRNGMTVDKRTTFREITVDIFRLHRKDWLSSKT